jgi:hypothetical protein
MNDISKVWISPWREMQRDLAAGLDKAERAGPGDTLRLQRGAVAGHSWLGRVHLRRVTATQTRH